MAPKAYLSHGVQGRHRIHIPEKKLDLAYFSNLEKKYAGLPGVTSVRVNPKTASVLIQHKLEPQQLFDFGSLHDLYVISELEAEIARGETEEPNAEDAVKHVHRVSFGLLLGFAAVQMARGNYLAPASSLIGDALNLWPKLRKRPATSEGDVNTVLTTTTHANGSAQSAKRTVKATKKL